MKKHSKITIEELAQRMDNGFASMVQKFDQQDKRHDGHDAKFALIEVSLHRMTDRLDSQDRKIDRLFSEQNQKIDTLFLGQEAKTEMMFENFAGMMARSFEGQDAKLESFKNEVRVRFEYIEQNMQIARA